MPGGGGCNCKAGMCGGSGCGPNWPPNHGCSPWCIPLIMAPSCPPDCTNQPTPCSGVCSASRSPNTPDPAWIITTLSGSCYAIGVVQPSCPPVTE
jgi:hypothetical protein